MEETLEHQKKALVAYFSCTGRTKAVAHALAEVTGADLYEIVPKIPYNRADLDWRDKRSRTSLEMNDRTSRPAIAGAPLNLADYDLVFVGFPIWWYVAPTIISTFLESHDFSGKVIVPFATSGGSGMGRTVERLRDSVAATAEIREGKLLNGRPSNAELAAWVENLRM